jgi:hypothetical protein
MSEDFIVGKLNNSQSDLTTGQKIAALEAAIKALQAQIAPTVSAAPTTEADTSAPSEPATNAV